MKLMRQILTSNEFNKWWNAINFTLVVNICDYTLSDTHSIENWVSTDVLEFSHHIRCLTVKDNSIRRSQRRACMIRVVVTLFSVLLDYKLKISQKEFSRTKWSFHKLKE